MAEVRKRNDTYQVSVFLGRDQDGKKLYKRTTFVPEAGLTPRAEKKALEAFVLDFESRAKNGDIYDGERLTFAEFVPVWQENWAKQNLTQRSQEEYMSNLNRRILPAIGNMKLSKIRPVNCQSIITAMVNDGKAVKTIKYMFTAMDSVFKYAYRMEVIRDNPCARCELPKQKQKEEALHYFTVEQAQTFINALSMEYTQPVKGYTRKTANGTQTVPDTVRTYRIPLMYQVYFRLALNGSFRRGELCALTWNDIDFDNQTITINKAISKTHEEGQIVKDPKSRAGNREISISANCFPSLWQWKQEEMRLCMKLGTAWKGTRGKDFDNNRVFIRLESGLPIDVDTLTHKFPEIIDMYNATCEKEEDKLPKIRLHDLRHTSITMLLANGVDIETVSKRAGHSKASITLDVYGHALESMDRKASSLLDQLFA